MSRTNRGYKMYSSDMRFDRNNLLSICYHLKQAEELLRGLSNHGITQEEKGKIEAFIHKLKTATYITEFLFSRNISRDNASRLKHFMRELKATQKVEEIPF